MAAPRRKRGPAVGIRIRMYCGLGGDCFLIRLTCGDLKSHILIDCGAAPDLDRAADRMKEVAADIVRETGGKLDLLIVTNRDPKHIAGFGLVPDLFLKKLKVRKLWLGWPQNGADKQATALTARFDLARSALADVAERLGPPADMGPPQTGDKVLEALKAAMGEDRIEYLEPGQVVWTPGELGLKAYVLAPPRLPARLFNRTLGGSDNPSMTLGDGLDAAENLLGAAPSARETIPGSGSGARIPGSGSGAVLARSPGGSIIPGSGGGAILARSGGGVERVGGAASPSAKKPSAPFSKVYQYYDQDVVLAAKAEPSTAPARDAAADWLYQRYYKGDDWRRIDTDWLQVANSLALQLETVNNNTSLVLAFETPGPRDSGGESAAGPVLLFAGDAQQGSWMSWRDQSYAEEPTADAGQSTAKIDLKDILSRTVLLKVGDHGDADAEAIGQALGSMTAARLTVLAPALPGYPTVQDLETEKRLPPSLILRALSRVGANVLRGDVPPSATPPRFYVDELVPAEPVRAGVRGNRRA